MAGYTEEIVDVGGAKVHTLKGGSGEPLLVLHGASGNTGWLRFAQALSDHYTVYYPSHPGYGQSDRPDWLESVPDMAAFYTWYMETVGLDQPRVIGFSLGGWIAAEIAATTGSPFAKMMLVGAAGIKPIQGEITDIFIISPAQVRDLLFHDPGQAPEYESVYARELSPDEQLTADLNREMTVRLTWKPYMHDPRLTGLLARVKAPTRMVWGREDRIVPVECGTLFQKAIPGSELVVIDNCGHSPQVEKPEDFIKTALEFLT